MIVGVTGGAGFIGSYVQTELRARGHEPVVFDHRGRGGMLGDVRDATAVTEFAAHVEAIIHLAGVLGTQETIANPQPAAETNVLGTINLLAAAHQYRLPFVNITVGNHWMRNTYSTTKACAARLVEQYRDELGLAAVNVRPVNAYGPGQVAAWPFGPGKVRKIMPAFICRALSGLPVEVYGDGSQVSDCVYVADVARVLVASVEAAGAGRVPERTVEVGPACSATVNDVAEIVEDEAWILTGVRVPRVWLPMRPGELPGARVSADVGTLAQVGVDPAGFVGLEDGVRRTVRWFDSVRGTLWRSPA